jgi:hypothetical protein
MSCYLLVFRCPPGPLWGFGVITKARADLFSIGSRYTNLFDVIHVATYLKNFTVTIQRFPLSPYLVIEENLKKYAR